MEREVDSKFEFYGRLLRVEENRWADCKGCFMFEHNLPCRNDTLFSVIGECFSGARSDNKYVIFVEIK